MTGFEVKIGSVNPRFDDHDSQEFRNQDDAQDWAVEQLTTNIEGSSREDLDPQLIEDTDSVTTELQRLVTVPFRAVLGDSAYEPIYVEINECDLEPQGPDDGAAADRAYERAGDR